MRRVIYAWNYLEWGGAQIHILALIKEVRKEFETVVVLPEGSDPQLLGFLDAQGVRYALFPGHFDLNPASTVSAKLRRHCMKVKSEYGMLRQIEKVGIEDSIIHVDLLPTQSLLALAWLCLRVHVFTTSHNALPPVPRWRWLLWKIKFRAISLFDTFHVFCTNRHAAEYFSRLYSRRIANDIKITYDSIDPAEIDEAFAAPIDREQMLAGLGLPTDKFIVLAVGQFIDRKGRWTFLEAARRIKTADQDILFVWVTPRMPNEEDARKLESYDLGEMFYLIRSEAIGAERQEILRFFRVGDAYALPSLIEGLPISLLEAMALRVPSISTNVYGIPEAIIHEKTGLLIEAGDAEALACSILRLKSDADLRRRLSDAGREHVIENFDVRIAARTVLAAYKAAIADS